MDMKFLILLLYMGRKGNFVNVRERKRDRVWGGGGGGGGAWEEVEVK